MIMDQVSDVNRAGFYKIAKQFDIPADVMSAKLATADSVEDLRSDGFADPWNRKFPIDSAADTYLSYAYFTKFAGDYDNWMHEQIQANFDKAANFWRIKLPKLRAQKEAAEPLKIRYEYEGAVHAEVPIHNDEDLMKLAHDLRDNPQHYPYEMRCKVARQILALNPPCSRDMTIHLQKTAAYGVGTLSSALRVLEVRKACLRRPDLREKVAAAAKQLETAHVAGVLSPAVLEKTARFADCIDRLSGLHTRYGTTLAPPEQGLFRITLQEKQDFTKHAIKLADGTLISEKEAHEPCVHSLLENLTGQKIAEDEIVNRLKQLDLRASKLVTRVLTAG